MKTSKLLPAGGTIFRLTPTIEDSAISVVVAGNADLNAKETLASFLGDLHAEALELSVTHVLMDIRKLEFMNSSCIKELLLWLKSIARTDAEKRYEVRFMPSPHVHWQKRTIESLQATTGVKVVVV
jgi:hypothetical protein